MPAHAVAARDAPPRDAPPRDAPPRDAPPRDAPPRDAPPRDAPPLGAALADTLPSAEPPPETTVVAAPALASPSDAGGADGRGPAFPEVSDDTGRDPASRPLPLSARLAGAVGDRLPVPLKAFRIGVDGRVVAAVAVLALLAIVFAGVGWWHRRPQPVAVPPVDTGAEVTRSRTATPDGSAGGTSADASRDASASDAPGPISVHVVGRVASPGVLVLPAGVRVDDVLKAAGGVLPGTDLTVLNLARVVGDGEQIPVGVPGATAVPYVAGGSGASGASPGAKTAQSVIDLNTATAEQLETLPGIGPVTARSIVEWRQDNGRFTSIDQLREIRGIGESRFADLRAKVRV
ncbi:helix-hairpin-helix domain-containing protein [Yinghuangia sp. ASG 101]|uniref:ComEA family DNA-binding protein n=1 Tax=Yinghuangia sp. ASG 101 TaxID=2896848 RepID=UPI001E2D7B88|nr:ComEA family DNA-binding protein [Yinghuangia sp. ASG 101]UGQ09825.1 helix-hairpin-helix domain-containing protein [Yinghuangia sp. ASG 101]